MLETLMAFIKTLPLWLGQLVQVLFVAIVFLTSITFLAGIWVGLLVVGKRVSAIEEITFFPPRIKFKVESTINSLKEQING
jgi:hypothetical protein